MADLEGTGNQYTFSQGLTTVQLNFVNGVISSVLITNSGQPISVNGTDWSDLFGAVYDAYTFCEIISTPISTVSYAGGSGIYTYQAETTASGLISWDIDEAIFTPTDTTYPVVAFTTDLDQIGMSIDVNTGLMTWDLEQVYNTPPAPPPPEMGRFGRIAPVLIDPLGSWVISITVASPTDRNTQVFTVIVS